MLIFTAAALARLPRGKLSEPKERNNGIMDIIAKLAAVRIVPVLVAESVEAGVAVCDRLCEGGLPAAEITFRTAAAEEVIREASRRHPEMTIGAGTVLNTADLHRAIDAGASFAVAPGCNPKVVAEAQRIGFPFVPGICTPSEIEMALDLGVKLLKFFPAEASGGVAMLKSLAAPYRHLGIRFMPTGGIKPANAEAYLAVPEVAAIGGTWLNAGDPETIREAAEIAKRCSK